VASSIPMHGQDCVTPTSHYGHASRSLNGLDYAGGAQLHMRETVASSVPMHGQDCVTPTSHPYHYGHASRSLNGLDYPGGAQLPMRETVASSVPMHGQDCVTPTSHPYDYGHASRSLNGLDYPGGAELPMPETIVSSVPMHGQNCATPTSHRGTHPMLTLDSREIQWDNMSNFSASVQAGYTTPSSQRTPRSLVDPPARTIPVNPRMKNIRELPFHRD
jgi:hypothetical protein